MKITRFVTMIVLAAALWLAPVAQREAHAGYEWLPVTLTIDSGTSLTTSTVILRGITVRDVVMFVPTLDAGDTALLTLEVNTGSGVLYEGISDTREYKPRGWADKAVGATDDNDTIKVNASQLSFIVDQSIDIGFATSTNQAADREILVWIQHEY